MWAPFIFKRFKKDLSSLVDVTVVIMAVKTTHLTTLMLQQSCKTLTKRCGLWMLSGLLSMLDPEIAWCTDS